MTLTLDTVVCYYNAIQCNIPDSKVHGANMGPIWGRQDPGGPHVGPMNLVIWDGIAHITAVTDAEYKSEFEHTKTFCYDFEEKRPRYNGTALCNGI